MYINRRTRIMTFLYLSHIFPKHDVVMSEYKDLFLVDTQISVIIVFEK